MNSMQSLKSLLERWAELVKYGCLASGDSITAAGWSFDHAEKRV